MGNYDIPAMINKILEVTEHEKLFYIGKESSVNDVTILGGKGSRILRREC